MKVLQIVVLLLLGYTTTYSQCIGVELDSQEELIEFSKRGCTTLQGLVINGINEQGLGVSDVSPLSGLTSVSGGVLIRLNLLNNLDELKIENIGGNLQITNVKIKNLNVFNNLVHL